MKNLFGQLFIDISDRLKSKVLELRWIDQDFGQLEMFEYKPSVSFPCALIDFIQANYTNEAQNGQFGELMIQVRLGFTPFSQSSLISPTDVREKALSFYDVEQKVFEALMGWAPNPPSEEYGTNPYVQSLVRVSAITEHRENDPVGLRVRVLTFSTAYEDYSANPVYTKHPATLQIDENP
jgi:hypothetical protein